MNVALSALPDFACLPGLGEHHQSGIVIAPTLDYMDRAYMDAKREGWSREPIVEMLITSTVDESLAPAACHVGSLFCPQFPPLQTNGRNWEAERHTAADNGLQAPPAHRPNQK